MTATQKPWADGELEQALQRLESALHASEPEQTDVTAAHSLTWRDLRLVSDIAQEMRRRHTQQRPDLDTICAELSQKFNNLLTAADIFNHKDRADVLSAFDHLMATTPDLIVLRDELVQQALRQRDNLALERWFIHDRLMKLTPDSDATSGRTVGQLLEAVEATVSRAAQWASSGATRESARS